MNGPAVKCGCWLILALVPLVFSCAGPRNYARQDVDWAFYTRVGVAPFQNVSGDRSAGEKVTSAFITELLLTEVFEVAEPGSFARTLAEVLKASGGGTPGRMTEEELKLLGENAHVEGVLFGTVREYEMVRVGQEQFPLVSIDLRLVDTPTGTLIWMASVTRRGGPKLPFVSIGETHTLGQLSEKVCRELAQALARNLR